MTPGQIVIDSGAAESGMPRSMLPEALQLPAKKGVRFAAAIGGELGNYGRKVIYFIPREASGFSRRA